MVGEGRIHYEGMAGSRNLHLKNKRRGERQVQDGSPNGSPSIHRTIDGDAHGMARTLEVAW